MTCIVNKIISTTHKTEIEILGATLLSIDEAENLLTKEDMCYDCWWWLRSKGYDSFYVSYVDGFGDVHDDADVDDIYGCVRPVLKIDITGTDFKIGDVFMFGDKKFKIISENIAWMYCSDIGVYQFRYDYCSVNANDYEKSDIKKFVDKWFERVISE